MALYQKAYVLRSTICVESFIIVSQSARNSHFLVLCHSTTLRNLQLKHGCGAGRYIKLHVRLSHQHEQAQ